MQNLDNQPDPDMVTKTLSFSTLCITATIITADNNDNSYDNSDTALLN